MKRKFHFRSWEEEDRNRTGGYTFPLLDTFGDYSVSIYTLPDSEEDLAWTTTQVEDPKVLFSYVEDNRVVIIRAGFSLSDMGLAVYTTEDGTGKAVKRAKTLARPFRIHTERPTLRVKLIDGGAELDGAFVVSRALYTEAVNNLQIPGWHPVQRAGMIRSMDRTPIHNFRGVGHMTDVDTGDEVLGFAKGNVIVSDNLPDGVDMILTHDNFKSELVNEGGERAWACFEPQGPKPAWEDQQTTVNMPFLLSVPEGRKRMKDSTLDYLDHLISGEVFSSVRDLTRAEFSKDFAYDGDTFSRMLRWNVSTWSLMGMDYRLSPWMTERLGTSHMAMYGIDDHRSLRIPIPGAIRAQVVTEALVKLAGYDISVAPGDITWLKPLGVAVVNDAHWEHQIIPTHGGCDLDDFFVLRRDGDKCIITRNPNARGEYTIFDTVYKWWKGSEDARPLTKKLRPTPILDALGAGETKYLPLPSTIGKRLESPVRPYNTGDTITAISDAMTVEGGYGQYSIALTALNSVTSAAHPVEQVASEDGVDAFTQGGSSEDQQFVLQCAESLHNKLILTGKGVDPLIKKRLPKEIQELIPTDPSGPIATMKRVMMDADKEFTKKLRAFTQGIEAPSFLEQIGGNHLLTQAQAHLKGSRMAMWRAQGVKGLTQREAVERGLTITHPQDAEKVIFHFTGLVNLIEGIDDHHDRHLYVMALWYASFVTPTSKGKITDQAIFGTDVFEHLTRALVYFGVAQDPYLDDMGHIVRDNSVKWDGGTWTITCKSCNTDYTGIGLPGVENFHANDGICKTCR